MGPDETRRLVRVRRRAATRPPVGSGARRGLPAPGDQQRAVLREGQGSGMRLYAHAFLPCDPRPGAETPEIRVALRRGATVKFRLIGPDGQPARDVWVYSRAVLGPTAASATRMWPGPGRGRTSWPFRGPRARPRDRGPRPLPPARTASSARPSGLSGKMAAQGPVTVRLEPCGLAMARLVGPDGKPVTGQPRGVRVTMVVTPGPPVRSAQVRAGALAADEDVLGRVDPVNHGNGWVADAQGRIAWPALIPGATYRIIDRTLAPAAAPGPPRIRRRARRGPRAGRSPHPETAGIGPNMWQRERFTACRSAREGGRTVSPGHSP